MQLLTVTPITRGFNHPELTYFTKEILPVGAVIMVPIRNREVPAIIIATTDVLNAKSMIKASDFSIKKILNPRPLSIWSEDFIKSVQETSDYFVQPFGEVLLSLTPKTILNAYIERNIKTSEISTIHEKKKKDIRAIQCEKEERTSAYQRLIRESFVKNHSVFICAPTEHEVERLAQTLKHGIEKYVYFFHSSLTKKQTLERWQDIQEETHPVLIVGTPQYLLFPKHFETIVLEEEQSHSWRTFISPFIDLHFFIESFAVNSGSTLIIGSSLLRVETHVRIQSGEISEWNLVANHTLSNATTEIIDPRAEEQSIKEQTGRRIFQVLDKKNEKLLESAFEHHESVVLLTARKGLTPITICNDCGTIVRCRECENPLVIHKQPNDKRIYICHACGATVAPEEGRNETCPTCGGWRLVPLGIGIERVVEEIAQRFPKIQCFVFDSTHVKTKAQAKKIIHDFGKASHEKKPTVLVITPMAIPYLTPVDHSIIISIDSLFSIPDYRMHERIFSLILSLREKSRKTLSVQTRMDDTTTIERALEGKLFEFIEDEQKLRKSFSYPPFGTIIKITARGEREHVLQGMELIKKLCAEYQPLIPKTISRDLHRKQNTYRMHAILKLPQSAYPAHRIISLLATFKNDFDIEVNPEHLL